MMNRFKHPFIFEYIIPSKLHASDKQYFYTFTVFRNFFKHSHTIGKTQTALNDVYLIYLKQF